MYMCDYIYIYICIWYIHMWINIYRERERCRRARATPESFGWPFGPSACQAGQISHPWPARPRQPARPATSHPRDHIYTYIYIYISFYRFICVRIESERERQRECASVAWKSQGAPGNFLGKRQGAPGRDREGQEGSGSARKRQGAPQNRKRHQNTNYSGSFLPHPRPPPQKFWPATPPPGRPKILGGPGGVPRGGSVRRRADAAMFLSFLSLYTYIYIYIYK